MFHIFPWLWSHVFRHQDKHKSQVRHVRIEIKKILSASTLKKHKIHSHVTQWGIPTLIFQYTPGYRKKLQVALLLLCIEFTSLTELLTLVNWMTTRYMSPTPPFAPWDHGHFWYEFKWTLSHWSLTGFRKVHSPSLVCASFAGWLAHKQNKIQKMEARILIIAR